MRAFLRARGQWAGTIVVLALAWTYAWAGPQEADFLEAQGEAAFVAGDYAHAYRFFEQAFQADSSRTWTLHRQALCALHLGQYDKAEAILRQVRQRADARPDAAFDLGIALYMQGRYREALTSFDDAAAQQAAVPTLSFYRGTCLYRLGYSDRALPLLEEAYKALPERRAETAYYLGAAELAQNRPEAALVHLQEAEQSAPLPELRDQIDRLLVQAQAAQRQNRWWSASLDIGGGWDSNVFYEPESDLVSDRAGYFAFAAADLAAYPWLSDWGRLGVGYRAYRSVHLNTGEENLSQYDLTSHGPRLDSAVNFGPAGVPLELDFDYNWSMAYLADDAYETAHTFEPRLTVFEGRWTATQIGNVFEIKRFEDYPGRDAFYASPSLAQVFVFAEGRGRALCEGSYEHNDADSEEFTYRGFGGYVAGELPIVGRLSALTGFRARYLNYWHSDQQRIDRKYNIDASLRYQFLDWLSLSAVYSFQNNVSLERYSYEKHVYLLDLGLAF